MKFASYDRILFTGDSVTDAGRARPVGEGNHTGVGTGYVRVVESLLAAFYPELMLRISNTGTSGNTVRDLAERWQTDILDLKPDWLYVCIGVNDVWRQYDLPTIPTRHVYPEEYETTLRRILTEAKAVTKGITLMTPYYMEPLTADPMRARMDEYGAICRRIADELQLDFIDTQAMFDAYFAHRHSSSIAWDRIHPNQTGATLLARAILDEAGFDWAHRA